MADDASHVVGSMNMVVNLGTASISVGGPVSSPNASMTTISEVAPRDWKSHEGYGPGGS